MQEPHSSAASGVITYSISAFAAFSAITLNEVLIVLSGVLVVMRMVYETHDFIQRKADRKALRDRELK